LALVPALALLAPVPVARGAALDDALRCLDEETRLEARRDDLLREADSLGLRIEAAHSGGARAEQDLLRRAERLDREAQDLEMELTVRRADCRASATRALPDCDRRIAALRTTLASRPGDAPAAAELGRLRGARSRLQEWLAGPILLGYPLIPPDSTDTPESLAEKLRYHEEVRSTLRDLEVRLRERREKVTGERRALVEARRFERDLGFIDEGGRVSGSGASPLRGSPGDGSDGDGRSVRGGAADTARLGSGGSGMGADLGLVLALNPATPEESDRILRLVDGYLAAIGKELEVVTVAAAEIRRRLEEGGVRAPR
jgi:hypothetical protein